MSEYQVKIRGEYADDDGLRIEMPRTTPYQAWHEIPLPACPDCGGDLVWYEAGHVPGTRKCMGQPDHHDQDDEPVYREENGCGSLFSVRTDGGKVYLCRDKLFLDAYA